MALDGQTPAQAAGLKIRGWKALLQDAAKMTIKESVIKDTKY
jgi:hypothetical protein